MNEGVSGLAFLTNREVTQLQLSLKSRSIREVALTVCTIRSLAKEVKSILQDLCNDEPMVQQNASSAPGGHTTLHADTMLQRESSSYTHQNVPMPPPDQMYDSVTPSLPALNKHPSRLSLGTRSYVKMLRRHRCPHCPRTFTTQSSVYRHIKSHHSHASTIRDGRVNSGVLPAPPNLTQARTNLHSVQQEEIKLSDTVSVSLLHESESSSDKASSVFPQADTSVNIPHSAADENRSGGRISPLASSPEDHMSPMPSLADMFSSRRGRSADGSTESTSSAVKSEPDDASSQLQLSISDVDADIEMTSPVHSSQHYHTDGLQSDNMQHHLSIPPELSSATHLAGVPSSSEAENQIREAVEAQLRSNVHAGGMHQCTDCGWRSKSTSSMRSHMLSHKGILPFKCNICSYKTNKKHVLMRHYTIHTGEKPHKCPICSFGSLDHVELLKHMNKSHPGIHPYTCTVCGHHATTTLLLKKHMKTEHSMTPPRVRAVSGGEKTISTTAASPSATTAGTWRRKIDSASETIYSPAVASDTTVSYSAADNQPVFPS